MPIGVPELLVILVILLVIFGPKRLPSLGRQLGGGLREFKNSVRGRHDDDDDDDESPPSRRELDAGDDVAPPAATGAAGAPAADGDDQPRHAAS